MKPIIPWLKQRGFPGFSHKGIGVRHYRWVDEIPDKIIINSKQYEIKEVKVQKISTEINERKVVQKYQRRHTISYRRYILTFPKSHLYHRPLVMVGYVKDTLKNSPLQMTNISVKL